MGPPIPMNYSTDALFLLNILNFSCVGATLCTVLIWLSSLQFAVKALPTGSDSLQPFRLLAQVLGGQELKNRVHGISQARPRGGPDIASLKKSYCSTRSSFENVIFHCE